MIKLTRVAKRGPSTLLGDLLYNVGASHADGGKTVVRLDIILNDINARKPQEHELFLDEEGAKELITRLATYITTEWTELENIYMESTSYKTNRAARAANWLRNLADTAFPKQD